VEDIIVDDLFNELIGGLKTLATSPTINIASPKNGRKSKWYKTEARAH
jgi:hypothetical protein